MSRLLTFLTLIAIASHAIANIGVPAPMAKTWPDNTYVQRDLSDNTTTYPHYLKVIGQSMSGYDNYFKHYLLSTVNATMPGYKRQKIAMYYNENKDLVPIQFMDWAKEGATHTNRALDLYISGRTNFFTVELPDGTWSFVSDGRCTLSRDGMLITLAHSYPILGENGYIYLTTDNPLIKRNGKIYDINGEYVDRLKITGFENTQGLWTFEGTFFYIMDPEKATILEDPQYFVAQGYMERSNEPPGVGALFMMTPIHEGVTTTAKKLIKSHEKLFESIGGINNP
ncbi:hypothetical protein HOH87_03965 [bacterium]|jgi:flagellar basal body rod protein FlgF|nr:hypothetical protein [bacterium]